MEPETKLFRAVINQAIEDIIEPDDVTKPFVVWVEARRRIRSETIAKESLAYDRYVDQIAIRNRAFERRRRDALSWLTSNSRDFRFICKYADLDPSYVIMKVKSAELLREYMH